MAKESISSQITGTGLSSTHGQGCQIFLDTIYQNWGKCTKLPLNYHMAIKYQIAEIPNGDKVYQRFPFQKPPKFCQIWILGLKIYHLATLLMAWREG
jgi:hypothetical protein